MKIFLDDRTSFETRTIVSKKDWKTYPVLEIESPKILKESGTTILLKTTIFLKDWDLDKIKDFFENC